MGRVPPRPFDREKANIKRILFVTFHSYLDDSNGAAVASRAMLEALARHGFAVEALTGTVLELGPDAPSAKWSPGLGGGRGAFGGATLDVGAAGLRRVVARHFRATVGGVPVTLYESREPRPHEASREEIEGFLLLYEETLRRFRPDIVVTYGDGALEREVRTLARARKIAVAFALHNFGYASRETFRAVDRAFTPSRFAADHYRATLGLDCEVLPNLIDWSRAKAVRRDPVYLTFVNPTPEKGVSMFARIADELGRRRPDIPVLVVESRGTERTLVDCGLDLRVRGTVHLMGHTDDPRRFWEVARLLLLPSVWRENQPLVAIEAMLNGVPVIGSDRGGIPETLGDSGVVLPLPEDITPVSRRLPTVKEARPWVEAVIRLWDDPDARARQARLGLKEAGRWAPEVVEPRHIAFFESLAGNPERPPTAFGPAAPS